MMIELIGVGVPRSGGGWLLRELSTTFEGGTLVAVGASTTAERLAVLDVVAGRRIPVEGRAWIDRQPLMPETVRKLRRAIGDVDPAVALREHRSIGWNVMIPGSPRPPLGALLRLPRPGPRKAAAAALAAVGLAGRFADSATLLGGADRVRVLLARALAHGQRHLLVRELDGAVPTHDVRPLLALLVSLSHRPGHVAIVTLADPSLAIALADQTLVVANGRQVRPREDQLPSSAELDRQLRVLRT